MQVICSATDYPPQALPEIKGTFMPLMKKNTFTPSFDTWYDCWYELGGVPPKRCARKVVYLAWMPDHDFVKIGSATDIKSRWQQLSTASPFDVRFVSFYCPPEGVASAFVEHAAHALLSESRVRGEWFDCTPIRAMDAVDKASILVRDGEYPLA